MGEFCNDPCKWFNTEGWSRWHRAEICRPFCVASSFLSGDGNFSGAGQHFSPSSYPLPPPRFPTSSPPQRPHHLLFLHIFAPTNICSHQQQTPARGGKICILIFHYHLQSVFFSCNHSHAITLLRCEGVVSTGNEEVWGWKNSDLSR